MDKNLCIKLFVHTMKDYELFGKDNKYIDS